jgi:hypothetical protein
MFAHLGAWNGVKEGDGRLEATGYGGAHPSTVSNVNSRAFHPETLILLQQIYDKCLKELVKIAVSEPPVAGEERDSGERTMGWSR